MTLQDEENTLLRNVWIRLTRDVASHSRRTASSAIPLWKLQSPHVTFLPLVVRLLYVGFRDSKIFEPRTTDSLVPCPSPRDGGTKGPSHAIHNSATIALDISAIKDEDIMLPRKACIRLHKDACHIPEETASSFRDKLRWLISHLNILFSSFFYGDDIWTHYLIQWHKLTHCNTWPRYVDHPVLIASWSLRFLFSGAKTDAWAPLHLSPRDFHPNPYISPYSYRARSVQTLLSRSHYLIIRLVIL